MSSRYKYDRLQQIDEEDCETQIAEQNFTQGRIYGFKNNDITEDEINTDAIELSEVRSRGQKLKDRHSVKPQLNNDVFIEITLKKDDTLHSLSLKYGCPVSELKRVNNLIQDQDLYSRQTIKIPAKRHGLLLEMVEQEKQNGINLVPTLECVDEDFHATPANVRTLSIRNTLSSQGREASDFLNKMDSDIKNIVASTKNRLDSLEEVATVLTCRRIFPLRQKKQQSWGADCGIRWWNIVLIVFLIGLVAPLGYFLYYEVFKPP